MGVAALEFCYKSHLEAKRAKIPITDALKSKARLTLGVGRDFDNGRVSLCATSNVLWLSLLASDLTQITLTPSAPSHWPIKHFKSLSATCAARSHDSTRYFDDAAEPSASVPSTSTVLQHQRWPCHHLKVFVCFRAPICTVVVWLMHHPDPDFLWLKRSQIVKQ